MNRIINPTRLRILLAALVFLICYTGVIVTLVGTWATSAVYSYGFVVPLISGYMLWASGPKLRALRSVPDYLLGVPVTLAGIAMLATGQVAALRSMQQASLVVTLAGFILLLFGRAIFRVLVFPVLYLLLGMPIWDPIISRLQFPSQVLSGRIAVGILNAVGVPALQDATLVNLPKVTLEILRECSGVNQLVAIVVMALPAGYLLIDRNIRRIVLVGVAVVVAYLSNGSRIALIGFLAEHGLSNGDLRGMHLLEGLVVSAIGYAVIFGCLSFLSKEKRTRQREPLRERSDDDLSAGTGSTRVRRIWLEAAVLVVVLFAGVFPFLFRPADVLLSNELRSFPSRVDDWTVDTGVQPLAVRFPAIDDALVGAYPTPSGVQRFTAVDDELVRTYRSSSGERVRLYIGYHRHQQEGKELAGEASGALSAAASRLKLELQSQTIEVNQVVGPESGTPRGIFFWYDFNGRVVTNMYVAKAYMVWDALTRRRTNGAVIMVAWDSPSTGEVDASRQRAIGFVRAVLPLLSRYIPS